MTKKLYILIFISIVFAGFFLRFVELGKVPDSLNWDEVSWGYNAYSILKTGQDEHGKFMPLSFQAFGDYKQPVYVYLTSLSIGLFDLNNFSVRFPSAFLGSLTVIFVWLLVANLFADEKYRYKLALCAMFFFAISPWSIQFSRVAFEANIGIFFVISGISILLWSFYTKKYAFSYLGTLLMVISCYSYHSNKIVTPLLFISLLLFVKLSRKLSKKFLLILLLFFVLGNMFWLVDARTTARGRSVTFLSNQTPILENSTKEIIYDKLNSDILGEILHNRRLVYINYYLENYLSHFNPNFLFVTGDNARHHTFGMGVLYLASFPLIIIGLVNLNKRKYWIVWVWLLLAPTASALAVDAPNASRSLVSLPIWQILEAIGFLAVLSMKRSRAGYLIISIFSLLLIGNFIYFMHNYFYHTNSEYGIYWQHGYMEAVQNANSLKSTGKQIIFSDKYEQPYIFYLFDTKYDPKEYIESGGSSRIKKDCYEIDNVKFNKCSAYVTKGSIIITPEPIDDNKYKKMYDFFDGYNKYVGSVYERI